MNTFSVSSATYNGSSTDSDPLVYVIGTLNGVTTVVALFWNQIQQTHNAGGTAAVQSLIAVGFQNCGTNPPFLPYPVVPASDSPLPNIGNVAFQSSTCNEVMVGSWQA